MQNRNIKDPEYWQYTHWDWGWLNWCFSGTKIQIQDIDGHVEYKGYHLYIETKTPGAKVPRAQEIVHLTLQKQKVNTVLVIWGDPNECRVVRLYAMNGAIFEGPANNIDVALLVKGWFVDVGKRSRVVRDINVPTPRGRIRDLSPVLEKLYNTIGDSDYEK